MCEFLSCILPWEYLVRSCGFTLNGKELGIESVLVEDGFHILVHQRSVEPLVDLHHLQIQRLSCLHQCDQHNDSGMAMVGVHWPATKPSLIDETIWLVVSQRNWLRSVMEVLAYGQSCPMVGLMPVHTSIAQEHPWPCLNQFYAVVVPKPSRPTAVVILVKTLSPVGVRLCALHVPQAVSTAQLLLLILAVAPERIGAAAIRIYLNGQLLGRQNVVLANGDFVSVHSH